MAISDAVIEKLRAKLPSAALDESTMHALVGVFVAAGADATLAGICDGKASLARLDAFAPREVWDRMVYLIDLWINAYARGSEIIVIGSPAVPVEEGGIRLKALLTMTLALEAAGVLRIGTVADGKKTQFAFTLVDRKRSTNPSLPR